MKQWIAACVIALSACEQRTPPLPPSPALVEFDESFPHTNDGSSQLDLAVMSDNLEEVRRLLERGADPNARCCGGDKFALMEAFRDWAPPITHRVDIVRLLLAHGADPNMPWCPFETRRPHLVEQQFGCVTPHGITALMAAAHLDSPEMVEMLLAAGASPWPRDWLGASAADYASSERVLQQLARSLFPDEGNRSKKMLQFLAEFGGRPDWQTPWNHTVLSRAMIPGSSNGYRDAPPPPPPPGVDAREYMRNHVHYARIAGRVKAVLVLGADPNERVTLGGADWPLLSMAIHVNAPPTVQHLLDHHADANARFCVPIDHKPVATARGPEPGCTPAAGFTSLMWAARVDDVEGARVLLAHGADRTLKDWAGRTALDYASTRGMKDVLAAGR